jgi:ethanolamine-phosphate cytidylyltransferase
VVHGDDITSDSSGEDCYRFVKAANRFKVVKRTPAISTTDLVGRMLLCTRTHFIKSLQDVLAGSEGPGTEAERKELGDSMLERMRAYASDETGLQPGADVYFWKASDAAKTRDTEEEVGTFRGLFDGVRPKIGQRVVYVDGGFDLFSSGHIEFLRRVMAAEEDLARKEGWYDEQNVNERVGKGGDYPPAFVVAGVHDDDVINQWKGVNYPIMNIFERGLCVLQCKVRGLRESRDQNLTDTLPARQRCHIRRPIRPNKVVPHITPMGHSRCRLPRPHFLHAAHL